MRYGWNEHYAALYNRTYTVLYDAGVDEKLADELAAQRALAVQWHRASHQLVAATADNFTRETAPPAS